MAGRHLLSICHSRSGGGSLPQCVPGSPRGAVDQLRTDRRLWWTPRNRILCGGGLRHFAELVKSEMNTSDRSQKLIRDSTTKEAEICGSHITSAWKQTSLQSHELVIWQWQTQTRKTDEDLAGNIQRRPSRYGAYLDGCKEIWQWQTEMEKARRPMFRQEQEELRSKVR